MKFSTLITVSIGLLVGATIGVAKVSGYKNLPAVIAHFRVCELPTADPDGDSTGEASDRNAVTGDSATRESSLYDKAEAYLANNPRDRQRALVYGGKLVEDGEFERAKEFYNSRLSITPADADFVYGLGWTYENSKEWSKAAETYQQALKFDPQHLAAQNNLAWVLATAPEESVRDGKRAVKLAEQAMTQAGGRGRFIADTLAAAYAEAGKFDYAIKFQKWVINQSPADSQDELRGRLELYLKGQPYRSK